MCTWLGKWHEGGALWQHDYLAAFEDPFDAADNTARTLGTAVSSSLVTAAVFLLMFEVARGHERKPANMLCDMRGLLAA
jgi:hypothetical protein